MISLIDWPPHNIAKRVPTTTTIIIVHYICGCMGLLGKLSAWLGTPYTAFYRCANCDSRFEDPAPSCPKCGGEIDITETPEIAVDYWGPY